MKFCSVCSNMYYISIRENENNNDGNDDNSKDTLYYYCRNCGEEKEVSNYTDACVYTTQIKSTKQQFHHIINKYTKYDPTLPRVNTIPCPNEDCKKENPEVIYIRYDDEKQLYIYLCTSCDMVWRTDRFGNMNEI